MRPTVVAEQRGAASPEYVAAVLVVAGIVAIVIGLALPERTGDAGQVAADCLFTQSCPDGVDGGSDGGVDGGSDGGVDGGSDGGVDGGLPVGGADDAPARVQDGGGESGTDSPAQEYLDDARIDTGEGMGVGLSVGTKDKEGRVTLGVSVKDSRIVTSATQDGQTTTTVESEVSATATVGVDAGRVSGSRSSTVGVRTRHQVTLPEGSDVDPSDVTPFDLDTIPVGGRVLMDQSEFAKIADALGYAGLEVTGSVQTADGRSVAIERLDATTIRVTSGPTEQLTRTTGLGLGAKGFKASLGRTSSDRFGDLETAEFDLSTTAGQAGYEQYLATGRFPQVEVPGVTNVARLDTYDASTGSTWGFETPVMEVSGGSTDFSANGVVATYPDGSREQIIVWEHQGLPELVYSSSVDRAGDLQAAGTFEMRLPPADDQLANVLSMAVDEPGSEVVRPGQSATLRLTNDDVLDLMARAEEVAVEHPNSPIARLLGSGVTEGDAGVFLNNMMASGDVAEVITSLHRVHNYGGRDLEVRSIEDYLVVDP